MTSCRYHAAEHHAAAVPHRSELLQQDAAGKRHLDRGVRAGERLPVEGPSRRAASSGPKASARVLPSIMERLKPTSARPPPAARKRSPSSKTSRAPPGKLRPSGLKPVRLSSVSPGADRLRSWRCEPRRRRPHSPVVARPPLASFPGRYAAKVQYLQWSSGRLAPS